MFIEQFWGTIGYYKTLVVYGAPELVFHIL